MRPVHVAAAVLAASFCAPAAAAAVEGAASELALFDLDEQLKAETSVASSRARNIRETPGIVSVVNRDEFVAAGARNLFDVLMMVPGFQVGADVGNTTGLGFRGLWGSEGKVLVLVDGLPANDLLTGNVQLDAIPLEQVQSIEVVRGPGSALYGGFAELAVVQVATRGVAELEGGAAAASWGQMRGGLGSRSLTAGFGRRIGEGWLTAQATAGQGQRSDRSYVDGGGQVASLAGASRTDPLALNLGGGWRGLQVRFHYGDWHNETQDGFGEVLPAPLTQRFQTLGGEARWEVRLAPDLVLTPRLVYQRTTPWQQLEPSTYGVYDRTGERITGRVALAWHASPTLDVVTGAEGWLERGFPNAGQTADAGEALLVRSRYVSAAGFGEVSWDTPLAHLVAGARLEHHERYGSSFVPRLAATRLFAPFHAKLLYSRAFRTPAQDNLASNESLVPENTRVLEAEVGWQASEHLYLALNGFDTVVDDTIVFTTDAAPGAAVLERYLNSGTTGSRGLELDVRAQAGALSASCGYALYTARGTNTVDLYDVPGHPGLLRGFAGHKLAGRTTLRLPRGLELTATAVWLSERFGDTAMTAEGEGVVGRIPAKLDLGAFAWWRGGLVRGLDLGAGVHDLLDSGLTYVVPYRSTNGVHPPIPGASREVFLRIAWEPR